MAASQTYTGNGLIVTIADPENITKDECLQLARAGHGAWNDWRQAFPVRKIINRAWVNVADFAAMELRGLINDFSGFEFGPGANFRNAKFVDGINFDGSYFGDEADFAGAEFEGFAFFVAARFGENANFSDVRFRNGVNFSQAIFEAWARFDGSRIAAEASFRGTRFGNVAQFRGFQFGGRANFDGAIFGRLAGFDGAQFSDTAYFRCVLFGDKVSFAGTEWAAIKHFYGGRHEERKAWAAEHGSSPNDFAGAIFEGSTFEGLAQFGGRVFLDSTRFSTLSSDLEIKRIKFADNEIQLDSAGLLVYETFTAPKGIPVRFAAAPKFHGSALHQDTTFEGAVFPGAQGDEAAARAYRTLKLAFAQQQAIREEQRFFKLEMQEEAARESGWKRWLYRGYDFFSDFGFSIWRPLARLVLWPGLGFLLGYMLLMALKHAPLQTGPLIAEPALLSQWLQFTFANLAPLPDSELLKDLRGKLFDPDGKSSLISVAALVLETLQKLLVLIGYFLMGLALRNLFKMK